MLVRVLALAAAHSSVVERSETATCHLGRPTGPGAGMKPKDLTLDRSLKDGFFHVACGYDDMEEISDKHGDNRHRYEDNHPHTAFGNVSIVRYQEVVGREDQKPMTPQVCFDFCRTVPDMLFFGLLRGRECYCTPYFVKNDAKAAGEVCDMPCMGNHAKICGGMERASLYEMHMCAETKADIVAAVTAATALFNGAKPAAEGAVALAATLERTADLLKEYAAGIGDMHSHANGQEAKVMAGTLKHAGEAAVRAATDLKTSLDTLDALKDEDFGFADKAYEAEAALAATKSAITVCEETRKIAEDLDRQVHPDLASLSSNTTHAHTALGMYETVLSYFDQTSVSSVNTTLPTTCEGKYAGHPMSNVTLAQCAEACAGHAPKSSVDYCVAFQYYEYAGSTSGVGADLDHSLCFLYREVGKVDYYDCEVDRRPTHTERAVLLQRRIVRSARARNMAHKALRGKLAGETSDFARVGCYAVLDQPPRCELEKRPKCWGLKAA